MKACLLSLVAACALEPPALPRPPTISAAFDSGNVEVVDVACGDGGHEFRLKIRPDAYTRFTDETAHFQWFHFRASGVRDARCRFVLENAGDARRDASYTPGWEHYKTVASYDREDWWRVASTTYDGGELAWELTPERDSVWFAYFAPYSWERHERVVAELSAPGALGVHSVIGETLEGRPLDMLTFGDGPVTLWATARQHPGESMAEWCAEGLMRFLNDRDDPLSRQLRRYATIRVVPNMNPDGAVAGYLRTNAGGANLNREWASGVYPNYDAPTLERSPEVYHVLKAMDHFGLDAHVDIHGDEAIAANFFAGTEGIPKWDDSLAHQLATLSDALLRRSPDFQVGLGYPVDAPGEANMAVGSNAVAQRYGALSVTLEMPFKDTSTPLGAANERDGWSPGRAAAFGRALGAALLDALPVATIKTIARHFTKLRKHANPAVAGEAKALMAKWQKEAK
ncbi:hypothetical protein JL720_260 [Aureococcus anophagefferens]|nr:hypothetical protein JL720_260 [Aureococcus anophagefferens]